MTKNMTEGNPLFLIITFAIPLFLGNLLQQTYNVIDAMIVGRTLGAAALGGVGASSSVQFLIIGFCIGTAVGFGIPLAQAFGQGNYEALRNYMFHSSIAAAVIAVFFTLLCTIFCVPILHLLAAPEDMFADAYAYLFVIFLGIPFTILYNLTAAALRSVGDSRTPFIFLGIATVLNIFLDLFFILVLKWGCAGAAAATILSQAMSGFLCLLHIIRKVPILKIRREDCRFSPAILKKVLVMGLPMGLQYSITAIGSMIVQTANNGLGSVCISTYTVAYKVKQFAMCPFDAIATGTSVFCGQNLGAGKYERIKQGIIEGTAIAALYGTVAGISLVFFGDTFAAFFVGSAETQIIAATKHFLFFSGISFWLLGFLNVLRQTTQALGYSGRAVFCGVFELIARAFSGFVLVPLMGFEAICIADQIAWILAVLYVFPICISCTKKVGKIIASRQAQNSCAPVMKPAAVH